MFEGREGALDPFPHNCEQTPALRPGSPREPRMRVLQIGKFYHPVKGGIETVVQEIAEGLQESGVEVNVLCFSEDATFSQEKIAGVEVTRVPHFGKLFSQPIAPTFPYWLKRLSQQTDLIHFHVPNPLAEASATLLDDRIPMVVTYHADVVKQKILIPFYKPFLKSFLNKTSAIVTPTKKHILNSDFISDRESICKIIPFGIDESRLLSHTPEHSKRSAQIKTQYGRFILFVGRLVAYKGLSYLIDAMTHVSHSLPDLNLVIIGNGPLNESLKHQASTLKLPNQITFLEAIKTQEELNSFYDASECFVLPSTSRAEAFGMVLLEAMAFGKPLITTRIGTGVEEVNVENVTGLHVPPQDALSLANAIITLGMQPALREQMGQAARNKFTTQHTRKPMIEKYLNLYEEILKDSAKNCSREGDKK